MVLDSAILVRDAGFIHSYQNKNLSVDAGVSEVI